MIAKYLETISYNLLSPYRAARKNSQKYRLQPLIFPNKISKPAVFCVHSHVKWVQSSRTQDVEPFFTSFLLKDVLEDVEDVEDVEDFPHRQLYIPYIFHILYILYIPYILYLLYILYILYLLNNKR